MHPALRNLIQQSKPIRPAQFSYGYSKTGLSIIPPSGYQAWLYGGTTDGTVEQEKVGVIDDVVVVQRPVCVLDGAGDVVNFTPFDVTSTTLSMEFQYTSGEAQIFQIYDGTHPYLVATQNSTRGASRTFVVETYPAGTAHSSATFAYTGALTVDAFYVLEVVVNSSGVISSATLTPVGGGSAINFSSLGASTDGSRYENSVVEGYIGSRTLGTYLYEGKVSRFSVTNKIDLTFEEVSGYTVYDVSGNANHGTITSPTAGITTVRKGREAVPSYIEQYGFRLSGGVQIPALLDGSSAADGNPLTNLSGYLHNGGAYSLQWPLGLGLSDDIVTNGTFDTDTDWTKGAGWTISAGKAHASSAVFSAFTQAGILTVGHSYLLTFDVSNYSSGTLSNMNFSPTLSILADGSYAIYITATGTDFTFFGVGGFTGDIDNVVLYPVYNHSSLLALAMAATGEEEWSFSYDGNNNIKDGLYYSPALTGADATQLLNFLNSRH